MATSDTPEPDALADGDRAGDPASVAPSEEDGHAAGLYRTLSEQAQKDLMLILEYLTRQSERTANAAAVENDTIRDAARICATPFDELDDRQVGEIWVLLRELSCRIAPATVEGLRRTMGPGVKPWDGFKVLIATAIILLVGTLSVQAYTTFGARTLHRMNEKIAEVNEVWGQINDLEALLTAPLEVGRKLGKDGPADLALFNPTTLKRRHLLDRADAISGTMNTLYQDMYAWNGALGWPLTRYVLGQEPGEYWGFKCDPEDKEPCKSWLAKWQDSRKQIVDKSLTWIPVTSAKPGLTYIPDVPHIPQIPDIPTSADLVKLWEVAPLGHIHIKYGSEVWAQSVLETLRGVILPVLYGMLGACVWLLRDRYGQLRLRRWRSPGGGEYMQRVFLGGVLGAALGYLNPSSFLPQTLANISLTGVAFIIGYNIEFIFSMFDKIFGKKHDARATRSNTASSSE